MAITQREAFAQVMEHLCTHNGGAGHGYSQYNRMGDGTTETIGLSDGTTVTIAVPEVLPSEREADNDTQS